MRTRNLTVIALVALLALGLSLTMACKAQQPAQEQPAVEQPAAEATPADEGMQEAPEAGAEETPAAGAEETPAAANQ